MRVFGLTITRQKAAVGVTQLSSLDTRGSWWPIVREAGTGFWQRNIEVNQQSVLTYSTVWACLTLIAGDISKLWLQLLETDAAGIRTPVTSNSPFLPVIRKPNHYQTRVKFVENWMLSKLVYGNTYVLKRRDARGVVDALYILDPSRVKVLVAPDGSVFYQLAADDLAGLDENSVTVPGEEIIHDIMVPLFHPLIGVSPIFACGLAAVQGLRIQNNSTNLFQNGSQLSGVLTAPGAISNEVAQRVMNNWDANFAGEKGSGKIAVFGDGLKFEPLTMTAVDAQLIEQLKWTAETVCACFHVPGYMVGVGSAPPYTDIQSINLQYYNQALQNLIENFEVLLDEGLELPTSPRELHVECDLSALLRMDSKTQTEVLTAQVGGGYLMPNEARAELDRKPVKGGDTCYLQQQNFSLAALDARDKAGPAPLVPGPSSAAPANDTPTGQPPAAAAPKALTPDQIRFQLKAAVLQRAA